jgi:hypothetical protein
VENTTSWVVPTTSVTVQKRGWGQEKSTGVPVLLVDQVFLQSSASTCQLFCLFSTGGPEPVLGFGVSGFGVLGFGVLGFGRGLSLVREMNATYPCCGCGLVWSQDTCVVCASTIYFRMQNASTTSIFYVYLYMPLRVW